MTVRLRDGSFAVNRSRPPQFTAQNWQTAYLIDDFIPPQSAMKRSAGAREDGFICEDGLCTLSLRDGRIFAYTAQEEMHEIACNVGDVVVLAIAGKDLSCTRSSTLVIGRQELALKGTLEIRLGEEMQRHQAVSPDPAVRDNHQIYRFSVAEQRKDAAYADYLNFSVGAPTRPWQLHRLYSRAARGQPEREYKKRAKVFTIGVETEETL